MDTDLHRFFSVQLSVDCFFSVCVCGLWTGEFEWDMITERESARGYGGAPQAATAGMDERMRGNDEEAER